MAATDRKQRQFEAEAGKLEVVGSARFAGKALQTAVDGNTRPAVTNEVLYQLSYAGTQRILEPCKRTTVAVATFEWKRQPAKPHGTFHAVLAECDGTPSARVQ